MHDFKVIPSRMCRLAVRHEPQQHLIEIVGVRASPPTYIEQYRINNKSSTSGVLKLSIQTERNAVITRYCGSTVEIFQKSRLDSIVVEPGANRQVKMLKFFSRTFIKTQTERKRKSQELSPKTGPLLTCI